MARRKKAPGETLPLDFLRHRLPGAFLTYDRNGTLVVQTWPKKRPNWKNPTNLAQRELMKFYAQAAKDISPQDRVSAEKFAYGSRYTWRDVISRSMAGRFIILPDGVMMTPQEILDAISDVVGTMLVRTADGWVGLAPGPDGYLLTSNGPSVAPSFQEFTEGFEFVDKGTFDNTLGYNKGDVVTSAGARCFCWAPTAPAGPGPLAFDGAASAHMTIGTNLTLNDMATTIAGSEPHARCSAANISAGRLYFELEVDSWTDVQTQFGYTTSLSGSLTNQASYGEANGNCGSVLSGGGTGNWNGITSGNRNGICFSPDDGKFWYCGDVTAGSLNWNNSTSNDPGTNVGGINIGSMGGDAVPFVYVLGSAGTVFKLFSRPADLLISAIPTGFSAAQGIGSNPDPASDPDHWWISA